MLREVCPVHECVRYIHVHCEFLCFFLKKAIGKQKQKITEETDSEITCEGIIEINYVSDRVIHTLLLQGKSPGPRDTNFGFRF